MSASNHPKPFVVAIVATYRRSALLGRLLASLKATQAALAVVVVDNANDPETESVVREWQGCLEIIRLLPGNNLGCGGGLEYGEKAALERYPQATHFWILDDDAEVTPQALELMLCAMQEYGATAACPTVLDVHGRINWFPGLTDSKAFRVIKTRCTLRDYLERCGPTPVAFSWACGVSLLVTKDAVEQLGLHRADFWIRGDDIEFSLRLTYRNRGIFVPHAIVTHSPPALDSTLQAWQHECKKELSMLRNHAYMACHLPHGRRILRNMPGSLWRFIRAFGLRKAASALHSIWQGAALRLPAGAEPRIF